MGEELHKHHEEETPDVSHIRNPDVAHEESDVNISAVLKFGVSLFLLLLFSAGLMYALYRYFSAEEIKAEPPPTSLVRKETLDKPPEEIFPEPRLQIQPGPELRSLNEEENRLLTGYGWVDRSAGIARIPIEQAKEIVLQRGFSVVRPSSESQTPGRNHARGQRKRSDDQ